MSGWPWWLQAYTLVATWAFGFLLGLDGDTDHPIGSKLLSVVLAAIWPVTLVLMAGVALADWGRDKRAIR